MKTLYLVRHAKSDWSTEHLEDIHRPLNTRGYIDAYKMSAKLKEQNIIPDLIISSPAIRAISTALIFSKTLGYDPAAIMIRKQLYDSSAKAYMECISSTAGDHRQIMVFGHNPIITNFLNSLTTSHTEDMPTCSIAGVKALISNWKDLEGNKNELTFYDFPKNHA